MSTEVISQLRPKHKRKIMDLLSDVGVDVSDWKNYRGSDPSKNPRYCYEWSFVEPGKAVVLNLWYDNLRSRDNEIVQELALRDRRGEMGSSAKATVWRRRAARMEADIQTAIIEGLPIRVILLDGKQRDPQDPQSEASSVGRRLLDPEIWGVMEYDFSDGTYTLMRGLPTHAQDAAPEYSGFEGEQRKRFAQHRRREAALRQKKLAESRQRNGGRLVCEVAGCGFDFAEKYGEIGVDYAHVHHKVPLSLAPIDGRKVTLDELAVVCANCHAMIHVGGQCRPLENLIP